MIFALYMYMYTYANMTIKNAVYKDLESAYYVLQREYVICVALHHLLYCELTVNIAFDV